MPLATRPNQTFDVVLSTDKKLPKKDQPVFVYRFMSLQQWQEFAKMADLVNTMNNDPIAMTDHAVNVIKQVLVDWRNMKINKKTVPFDPSRLKKMCSINEILELMDCGVRQKPDGDDKKK